MLFHHAISWVNEWSWEVALIKKFVNKTEELMSDISGEGEDYNDHSDEEIDEHMNDIIPRPWISSTVQQTDNEIQGQYIPPGRDRTKLKFIKKRNAFGGELSLQEKDNDAFVQISAVEKHAPQSRARLTNEIGLQASNPIAEVAAQTDFKRKVNFSIQTNIEQNPKEVGEEDSVFMNFLKRANVLMEEALCSNETIDIFMDDFKLFNDIYGGQNVGATELSIITEIRSFEFQDCKKKLVSCIRFEKKSPIFFKNIMATSFIEELTFEERIEVMGRSYTNKILLWDYEDMHRFTPILTLISPIEITIFEFKPHDPNIIIGGAVNGQILLWDVGRYMNPEHPEPKKLGGGGKEQRNTHESIEVQPSVFSSFPSNYSIPPVIPPEGLNKKIVNSHKNAVTSINFLPQKLEFERKNKLVFVEHEEKDSKTNNLTSSY